MSNTIFPRADPDLKNWLQNFAERIEASPGAYGVTKSEVHTIKSAVSAYAAALTAATTPRTRTKPKVAAKDAARSRAIATVRPYVVAIQRNRGIANAAKLALGLRVSKTLGSSIPAPSTSPILAVIGATPGVHTIRFADSNTPDKRAKPAGVVALQLFRAIGPRRESHPSKAAFYASVTRQPYAVKFTHADNGKVATYFGRWITRTGLTGPWSGAVLQLITA